MIIVRLRGGLGNQLFQYACGRMLSLRNGDSLKLDTTGYAAQTSNPKDTVRVYSLSNFAIIENIATDAEIKKLKYSYGLVSKALRYIRTKIFRQFNIGFDSRILSKKGDLYLDGFWQTELFFKDFEGQIRRDLTLRKPLGTKAEIFFNTIKSDETAVSLHVRRGDYASDPAILERHGLCSPDYYARALTAIAGKVGNINIYVFSDDITWVRENMKFPFPVTFVSTPSIADYEEIILMSACRHHIIANSSFSWWGAWLNPLANKIVIAPKRWVAIGEHNHKDTVPTSWIRL